MRNIITVSKQDTNESVAFIKSLGELATSDLVRKSGVFQGTPFRDQGTVVSPFFFRD